MIKKLKSKRMKSAVEKIKKPEYSPEEACLLIKDIANTKFDETVDVSVNLGVDPRHADQNVRGAVVLPHGLGKTIRVLVFAKGEKIKEAESAGADFVGGDELAKKIQGGWLEFDATIATPDMMPVVGRLGKILAPRGLMPNPKVGTVTLDVKTAISDVKAGRVEFKVNKAGIVQVPVGKKSFEAKKLQENFSSLMDAITKAKPSGAKGTYIKSVYLSSTMSPSLKIDASNLK